MNPEGSQVSRAVVSFPIWLQVIGHNWLPAPRVLEDTPSRPPWVRTGSTNQHSYNSANHRQENHVDSSARGSKGCNGVKVSEKMVKRLQGRD